MSEELIVWWDLDRPNSPNPVIVRINGGETRMPVETAVRYRDDFTYILNHPSVTTPPPPAEEALPEGWTWGHDEDGHCAMGPFGWCVWVADGTLRHTCSFAPIAVVLAVIRRNSK